MTTRCYEGRLLRVIPASWTDPAWEDDAGQCPECRGLGCDELASIEKQAERQPEDK